MFKTSLAIAILTGANCLLADSVNNYAQTNLTSDLPGVAAHQDPNLVNPWGIVAGPTTPFWINDNGMGLSTLYNGSGTPQALVVTVPPPAGSMDQSAPTGIVFNGTSGFGGSRFIFDTEDGTISAWTSGTSATLQVTSAAGSVYKGLTMGSTASGNLLYASNFGLGRIDVFDSSFGPVTVSGGFRDNNIPAGYAPFNIQNIGGNLHVTYAQQDAEKKDDVPGAGHGFVDVFDTNGNLIRRLTSQGNLDSPWGLALAPTQFGAFSGALLVGNFGDGTINAYDPSTGTFLGTLSNSSGGPIVIDGLWGLSFGNGVQGQDMNTLFFTAGIPGPDNIEDHGLFGSLAATTPEPAPVFLLLAGASLAGLFRASRGGIRTRKSMLRD